MPVREFNLNMPATLIEPKKLPSRPGFEPRLARAISPLAQQAL